MSDKSGKCEVKPSPENEKVFNIYFDLQKKNWFD